MDVIASVSAETGPLATGGGVVSVRLLFAVDWPGLGLQVRLVDASGSVRLPLYLEVGIWRSWTSSPFPVAPNGLPPVAAKLRTVAYLIQCYDLCAGHDFNAPNITTVIWPTA